MTLYLPPSLRGFVPGRVVQSMWTDHMPFAYDLVGALWPKVIVELGTQYGLSYFTFCQSVAEHEHPTRCFAVDTWQGDAHSGVVNAELNEGRRDGGQIVPEGDPFTSVTEYNKRYAEFSELLQMTFDEALPRFEDESISLLHIDGCHTYEAVKADYAKWYPKVEPGGIILLHDTNARLRDYGVWRFWQEVSEGAKAFEFKHCYGLGVLQKPGGAAPLPALLSLLFSKDPRVEHDLRVFYAHAAKFQLLSRRRLAARRLRERVRRKKIAARPPRKPGGPATLGGVPDLSIVVPISSNPEVSDRCLYALSAGYQRDVQEPHYEVLAAEQEGGAFGEARAIAWGANIRYLRHAGGPGSWGPALRSAVDASRGAFLGLFADSLHVATPTLIEHVFAAFHVFPSPLIVVPPYDLARKERGRPPVPFASPGEVASALEEIDWKLEGHRLFETAAVGKGMPAGLMGPVIAPVALFFPRSMLDEAGGLSDDVAPTGGDALGALYRKLVRSAADPIVLLVGEGVFNQVPWGAANPGSSATEEPELTLFGAIPGQAQIFLRDGAQAATAKHDGPVQMVGKRSG